MSLKSSEKSERTYGLDSRNINKPSKNDNYTVTSLFRKLPNCRACFLLLVICTALTSGYLGKGSQPVSVALYILRA